MKKSNVRFSISRLLYNTKFLVVFSIVASFACWLVISLNQNPTREKVFSDVTVNLSIENTAASELGLDIISGGIGEKVNVTISGPNYIVSSMSASDILVTASLSEVTGAGKYDLKLNATPNSTKTGYSFLKIVPETIPVTFDYIDTKEFDVIAEAIGAVAVKGLVVDTPMVSDSEFSSISIKGARTDMQRIDRVVASAEVNQTLNETGSFPATIKLLDSSGKEIDKSIFNISTDQIMVSVPISKKAELPIKVEFTNAPAGLPDAIKYTLSHSSVTVLGPKETINKLSSISLIPININQLSKTNNSFDVAMLLPDGVKALDNIEYVTVKFNTSSCSEKLLTVSSMKYTNVQSGLKPSASSSIKNVKICGPTRVLRSIDDSDLYALVDMSQYKAAGQYTVTAKIMCEKSSQVWQVGEYSVIVTLK